MYEWSVLKETFKQNWQLQKRQTKEFFFILKNYRKIIKDYRYSVVKYEFYLKSLLNEYNVRFIDLTDDKGNLRPHNVKNEIDDLNFEVGVISSTMFPFRRRYYLLRIITKLMPLVMIEYEKHSKESQDHVNDKMKGISSYAKYY
jgi:hypothetical protein